MPVVFLLPVLAVVVFGQLRSLLFAYVCAAFGRATPWTHGRWRAGGNEGRVYTGLEPTTTRSSSPESASVSARTVDDSHHSRREGNRRRQQTKRARDAAMLDFNERYSRDELSRMDTAFDFLIPSESRLREITKDVSERFGQEAHQTVACGVCECVYERDHTVHRIVDERLELQMQRCLALSESTQLPAFILSQYDVSAICPNLKGLLLYPPAFTAGEDGVFVDLCSTCLTHLSRKTSKPPAWAIANGNYIGWLPSTLPVLSVTEEMAIALVCPCVNIATVSGGPCRVIKSHHYFVKNTQGPIVEMLPRDLSTKVRVAVVGSMTPLQEAACRKRYQVRLPECTEVLAFLRTVDPAYGDVPSSDDASAVVNSVSMTWSSTDDTGDSIRDTSSYGTAGSEPHEGSGESETSWTALTSLIMSQSPRATDVLVRRSNAFESGRRWASCVKMYPTLFPAGRGGPGEVRPTRLSVHGWMRRCLKLHSSRFANHHSFLLLGFDYLATERARNSLYYKLSVRKTALRAGAVSAAVVKASIDFHRRLCDAQRLGCQPPPVPSEIGEILNVRRGLYTCEGAHFGSNAERSQARHDLFGYLKRLGPIQVFFTLSPDSAGTLAIGHLSGDISSDAIEQAHLALLPTRAERRAIAARHPVLCAEYFVRVVETTIDLVLGWDRAHERPKRGGGLFGVVKDFVCSSETQQCGDLHAHFVVWLHGFGYSGRKTREHVEEDESFKNRILALVDTTTSTTIPVCSDSSQHQRCIATDCDGVLKPEQPSIEAFRRPVAGATPVATSVCSSCGKLNRDKDVMNAALDIAAAEFGFEITTDHADYYATKYPEVGDCNDTDESRLELALVIREVQVHFWTHTKSCFKVTARTPRGSVCRFFRPAEINEAQTFLNDQMEVKHHRPIGSEYVNPYNKVILNTFKCNHDVRFIIGCGAKNVAAYICKYCIKPQNSIENEEAFAVAAFARGQHSARRAGMGVNVTTAELGAKVLSSMLYALTNKQEVSAPMAALYVLRGSPFWFSRLRTYLNLGTAFESVDDTDEEQVTVGDGEVVEFSVVPSSRVLHRYWDRPSDMDDVCLFELLEEWYERKVPASMGGGCKYVPAEKHKVLVISGKQLPSPSRDNDADHTFYRRCVLSLFKPHRSDADLHNGKSYEREYEDYIRCAPQRKRSSIAQFEETLADYYMSEQNYADGPSEEDILLESRGASPDQAQGLWAEEDDGENDQHVQDPLGDGFDLEQLPDEAFVGDDDNARIDKANQLLQSTTNLQKVVEELECHLPRVQEVCMPYIDSAEYASRVRMATFSAATEDHGTTDFLDAYPALETRVEKFEDCFQPVPWDHARAIQVEPSALPKFPTIAEVSGAFTLNLWQHIAFEVMARHLLYGFLQDCASSATECVPLLEREPYALKPQLRAYLGGDAGTGKSTVIHAVLNFARLWGREGTVETLSFTGVAAMNIDGRTIHSARHLSLN